MQNPFAHGNFRDRSRPFIVVVIILLGLLFVAAFFVKPAWRAIKDRRAVSFVGKARAAMAATNYAEAKANVVAAYAMAPFHPEVFRVAAEHYTRLGRQYGLQVWEQLEGTGAMNAQDRVQWAGLALATRSYEMARKALLPLVVTNSTDPDVLKLLSELFAAAGNFDLARQTGVSAWQAKPNRADLLLHLAKIEFASADPAISQSGLSKLMSLLVRPDPVAGAAALVLLAPAASNKVDSRLLSRLVGGLPGTEIECELAKLVIRYRNGESARAEEIAHSFVREKKLNPDDPRFMAVVLGLVSLREFRLVRELVPEDMAVGADDLSSIRLEALFRLGDWTGVESLLNRKNHQVSKPVEATYRAMIAHAHGHTNELPNLWRAAIAASQRSPDLLEIVAERAEYTGSAAEATQAWRSMLLFPESAAKAAQQIFRLAGQTRDLESVLQAYRQLSRLDPANSQFQLQVAFHRLLLGIDGEDANKTLAAGEAAFTDRNLFRITSALAELRNHKPDTALQWIEQLTTAGTEEPGVWKVIRAAALGQSGQMAKARDLTRELNPGRLSAAEFALVKKWL